MALHSLRRGAFQLARHTPSGAAAARRITRGRFLVSAAAAAPVAQPGDFVAVAYTGTLDDGTVFDSSQVEGRQPLEFQIGAGNVIKGFDLAVTGLAQGGQRKVRLPPADAYGEVSAEAVIEVPRSKAPQDLQEGDRVGLSNGMPARVTKVTDTTITLDLNHELAGKHLTFDVTLERLTPAASLKKATFGAGCFWGPELTFQRVPGVLGTEVGYSQGKVKNPTYEQVCTGTTGHTEVVQVTYDPAQVSYEQLLDIFWARHDPTALNRQGSDSGTQYRAGIYTHDQEQAEAAQRYKEAKRAALGPSVPIYTEVEPVSMYSTAEDYHQQYLSKGGRFGRAQNPAKGCNDPIRCYG